MDFDKINVTWVEDNPLQVRISVSDIIDREPELAAQFREDLYNEKIPAITFESEELAEYHKYFDLRVLQHPVEIREYIEMCTLIKNTSGVRSFPNKAGLLPDYLVIDYRMCENIAINQARTISYKKELEPIRRFVNPNFLLQDTYPELFAKKKFLLEDPANENYNHEDFLKAISKTTGNQEYAIKGQDLKELKDDDFGLFSGLVILGIFHNNLTIGIPATYNKAETTHLTAHGKYLEWINEGRLFMNFNRKFRGSKKWDDNLKDGAITFRSKVETWLELGKVIIEYNELHELAEGNMGKHRVIRLQTAYGIKRYPLDGLFIDIPAAERDHKISEWAATLIEIYSRRTGYDPGKYNQAQEAAFKLVRAYNNSIAVKNRFELSHLVVKRVNDGPLNASGQERLQMLSNYFGISEKEINTYIRGENIRLSNLTKNIADFRELGLAKENDEDNKIRRMVVLFTDMLLHNIYQEFRARNESSEVDSTMMAVCNEPPNFDDLKAALFPIPKNPLVLPYHYNHLQNREAQPFEAWEKALRDIGITQNSLYAGKLSVGENTLCRSFALQVGLKERFYPCWLTSH